MALQFLFFLFWNWKEKEKKNYGEKKMGKHYGRLGLAHLGDKKNDGTPDAIMQRKVNK